ncbi:MAG: FIG00800187: hypothetical protein [uncultured Phycisphaerae bacterium]|uniref:2'-5' RNA ligase family protein n=1 Tax=uncultured Phycisphaerae bacterium TaxID=904963 RepID=A0A6J4N8V4_9BACT|nr:MAG: FIG00800187: hypothetical protein [uncultured Phycisphaerae bacterium]
MSNVPAAAPLILTLGFDGATFGVVDRLRRAHFPPKRNFIPAHLTLFHHLPGERVEAVVADLHDLASRTAAFDLALAGPRFLGKGVALDVVAPPLLRVRADLATRWAAWLGPQDAQPYRRPHVTVQNKVDPAVARGLYERMRREWEPLAGRGESLRLWRYLGGPWEAVGSFPLADVASSDPALCR